MSAFVAKWKETMSENCPCGSEKSFHQCCEPIISGEKIAPDPESLMRSRYTAYTLANIDYIVASMRGKAAKNFNQAEAKTWAKQVEWKGLSVIKASDTHPEKATGQVEFIAEYTLENQTHKIHELSDFEKIDGQWFYIDGKQPEEKPSIKIARNAPCPCGSGKKYKRCCGRPGN